jgi:hypothetical protein
LRTLAGAMAVMVDYGSMDTQQIVASIIEHRKDLPPQLTTALLAHSSKRIAQHFSQHSHHRQWPAFKRVLVGYGLLSLRQKFSDIARLMKKLTPIQQQQQMVLRPFESYSTAALARSYISQGDLALIREELQHRPQEELLQLQSAEPVVWYQLLEKMQASRYPQVVGLANRLLTGRKGTARGKR